MSRIVTTSVLISTIAGLGWLNLFLLRTPVETGVLARGGAGSEPSPPAAPVAKATFRLDATTIEDFPQTSSRPVFWASRRPEVAKPAGAGVPGQPVQSAPQPLSDTAAVEFRLAGILHDGASGRRALLVWPQLPEGRWVAEGAQVAGWKLAGIGMHAVRIESGSRSRELKLP